MGSEGLDLPFLDLESNEASTEKVSGNALAVMHSGEVQNFAVFDDMGAYSKQASIYLFSDELKAVILPRILLGSKHEERQPDPKSSSEWVMLKQNSSEKWPAAANKLFDDIAATVGPIAWTSDKTELRSLCGQCGGGCGAPPPAEGPINKVATVISKLIVSGLVLGFFGLVCYHLCCRKMVERRRAAREQEARARWEAMSPEEQAEAQHKLDRELAALQQAAYQQEQREQRQRVEASVRHSLQMEEARRQDLERTEYARRMGW